MAASSIQVDDPIGEAKEAGLTRLRNPFYFSLLVSFTIINWQAIYYLVWPGGDGDALDRLNWIKGNLYDEWYWYALKVVVGPIAFACMYVTYIPRWLFRLERFRRKDIVKHANEIKDIDGGLHETQRIIGELTISNEQLQRQVRDAQKQYQNEIEVLRKTINQLLQEHEQKVEAQTGSNSQLLEIVITIARKHYELREVMYAAMRDGFAKDGSIARLLMKIGLFEDPQRIQHYTLTELGRTIAREMYSRDSIEP